jgi:hypothetical protein
MIGGGICRDSQGRVEKRIKAGRYEISRRPRIRRLRLKSSSARTNVSGFSELWGKFISRLFRLRPSSRAARAFRLSLIQVRCLGPARYFIPRFSSTMADSCFMSRTKLSCRLALINWPLSLRASTRLTSPPPSPHPPNHPTLAPTLFCPHSGLAVLPFSATLLHSDCPRRSLLDINPPSHSLSLSP